MTRPGPSTRLLAPVAVVAAVLVGLVLFLPGLRPWDAGTPAPLTAAPGSSAAVASREAVDPASGLPWVDLSDLPVEAAETLAAIEAGPPFAYRQDGTVFRNAEGLLPDRASGYYREFTVPTPGEGDRGARRIVTGGADLGAAAGEYYYTGDHYDSFARIRT